jgi:hypothetical protein
MTFRTWLDQTRRRLSARKMAGESAAAGACNREGSPEGEANVPAPDEPAPDPVNTRNDCTYVGWLGMHMISSALGSPSTSAVRFVR